MTAPRQIVASSTYLVTRRCSERQFFLRPFPDGEPGVLYLLALAAERFDIRVPARGRGRGRRPGRAGRRPGLLLPATVVNGPNLGVARRESRYGWGRKGTWASRGRSDRVTEDQIGSRGIGQSVFQELRQ